MLWIRHCFQVTNDLGCVAYLDWGCNGRCKLTRWSTSGPLIRCLRINNYIFLFFFSLFLFVDTVCIVYSIRGSETKRQALARQNWVPVRVSLPCHLRAEIFVRFPQLYYLWKKKRCFFVGFLSVLLLFFFYFTFYRSFVVDFRLVIFAEIIVFPSYPLENEFIKSADSFDKCR